jgi:hypothetical protein
MDDLDRGKSRLRGLRLNRRFREASWILCKTRTDDPL